MMLKGKIPFVRFLMPLMSGIVAGHVWPAEFVPEAGLWILFLLLLVICALLAVYTSHNLYRKKWIPGLVIHSFILLFGCYSAQVAGERFDKTHFSKFTGDGLLIAIRNEPRLSNNILRFEARALKVINGKKVESSVTGKLLVALKTDSDNLDGLNYGQMLILPFRFTEVEPPYNPGEFNYKAYLAGHQIYHQTFAEQSQAVILPGKNLNPVIAFAIRLRQRLVNKFERYFDDPQAASLASTLILGYRAGLSKEVLNAYSKTGTMHVLSVSGMHVGIVFLVLAFVLKPLSRFKELRLFTAFLIISIIWFYALLTGFSPSVCRAAVMISVIVLGKALKKSQNTYNLIAISAFLLLVYNPYYLFDVGFQLSYLAVLGLVFLHPRIYHAVYNKYWLPDQLWSYCALSIAAQLATFPISVYYFHQFPVYFLIGNLFIVLPVIVIMYGGILFLFIPWPFILDRLGWVLNSTIQAMNSLLFYIESLPFSTINGIWITVFQCFIMYAAGGCLIWAIIKKNSKPVVLSLGCVFLLCCFHSYKTVQATHNNKIVFFSLRKNSAVAYLKNRNALVMTDLPQADKTVSFSIEPYLDSCGIVKREYSGLRRKSFLTLGAYRILRIDKSFERKLFSYRIEVDAVLISENPRIKVSDINKYVKYSELLIDGTNPDYKIKEWQRQAKELHVNFHILQRNPAYIVEL